KNSNGTFTTYTGTCTSTESPNTPALAPLIAWATSPNQYCETGLGNVTLSSNGGVSHCND
ncbi:hypothetical protein, partial [Chryseobacterium indoltheticum]|uniref:hypothetical protein n=1 Tax=Chryseobacterium indoltheticum TaxID=254 RepID=UPI003F49301F